LQYNSDEKLQENETHYEIVTGEENIGKDFPATSDSLSRILIICESWVPYALVERRFIYHERGLCCIPAVTRCHREQCQEGIDEILKVHVVIHQTSPHAPSEKNHTEY
jgi:hypothetical protein